MATPTHPPCLLFTVGHYRHSQDELVALLRTHGVQRLVDVRSSPSSRHNPQHNHDNIRQSLESAGIAYTWHKVLGGREERNGNLVSRLTTNQDVIRTIRDVVNTTMDAAAPTPTAMMCSEAEWRECHRQFLAAYATDHMGVHVGHIRPDGNLEAHPRAWCAWDVACGDEPAPGVTAPAPAGGQPAQRSAPAPPRRKPKSRLQ